MPLLDIQDLQVTFRADHHRVPAVRHVDLAIHPDEIFALVGESGCGKTVTSLAVARLLAPTARIQARAMQFNGRDLLNLSDADMVHVRGKEISYIFQDPATALNPVLTIGEQLIETIQWHQGVSQAQAGSQADALLDQVGFPQRKNRLHAYPHELSGGMKQRVMIAIAISSNPKLIVADEPTTALDVTLAEQILTLLVEYTRQHRTALWLITHDLSVVKRYADRVAIMYAGQIVESCRKDELFGRPMAPYTQGLLASIPQLRFDKSVGQAIPGAVPSPTELPPGCPFHPRCPLADAECQRIEPALEEKQPGHWVRCLKVEKMVPGTFFSESGR